jgi:CheY-like chemotaxis protein
MRLVGRIVEAEKHDFLSAADGPAALGLIEQERPDLILLDINIPGVDGLEIARRLKANATLSAIPIIATTANVLIGDRERCLEAGCDAYLPKPLDVRELQEVLRAYLGRANGRH